MIDPFLDGSYGEWMTEPCEMENVFRYYWKAGFQIHVHSNGDKAMELVLKMVKMMQKESPRPDHRTTIEHAGNVPLLVRHWPCNSNFKKSYGLVQNVQSSEVFTKRASRSYQLLQATLAEAVLKSLIFYITMAKGREKHCRFWF